MLAKLWDFIVGRFCKHVYYCAGEYPIYTTHDTTRLPINIQYLLLCNKCCKEKIIKVGLNGQ